MSGPLGSARVQSRAGAPPPNPSPRLVSGNLDQPRTSATSRRQNAPGVRARRSPSRDQSGNAITEGTGSSRPSGSLSSRVTPLGSRGSGYEPYAHQQSDRGFRYETAPPRSGEAHLQQKEPEQEAPMSYRGPDGGLHSARLRPTNPMAGVTPIGRVHSGSSGSTPLRQTGTMTNSGPVRMARFAAPPSAGSGGKPSGAALRRTQNQHSGSRQSLHEWDIHGRRLSPSESGTSLRHSDAGSGGTGDREQTHHSPVGPVGGWCQALSRSTPALDMRVMSGRLASRETQNSTPRPQTSARVR